MRERRQILRLAALVVGIGTFMALAVGCPWGICGKTRVVTLFTADAGAGAAVFVPGDTNLPTGSELDLLVGETIDASGIVDVHGTVTAAAIEVL